MNVYYVAAYHNRIQSDKALGLLRIDENNATEHSSRAWTELVKDNTLCMYGHFFSASKGQLIKITKSPVPDNPLLLLDAPSQGIWRGYMISKNETWIGNLEYYKKGHKILLVDNFENKNTSDYLKKNLQKLQERHIICVTKDKDEPLYNDRINSFLNHHTPSATGIKLDLNHEQFAQAGYFREDEYLRCSGCLYHIHLNDVNRLTHEESSEPPPVKRKKITHSSRTSCDARKSLSDKVTAKEIQGTLSPKKMLLAIESDHNSKLNTLETALQKRHTCFFSSVFAPKACLRRSKGGNTFFSLVDENKQNEVQRYLELKVYQEPEGSVIKPDPDCSIIATEPNSQIINLLDVSYELSELPVKYQALRTTLIDTIYQKGDVSSIHNHRDNIVKEVQKIKLLETIEPFTWKLFTKIEKVRKQVPIDLDSSTSVPAHDSPNEMALMNHKDAPEINSMLKLMQMRACALPEDQEEIRKLLQALLTEIKALPPAAAEQGLAFVFCSQLEDSFYKDIFSCASLEVKSAEPPPYIKNYTFSLPRLARHGIAREKTIVELLKEKSDQLHASMEQTESLLFALTEYVLQPIRFILGNDYFDLDKEIRKKIFLETPSAAGAKGLSKESSYFSSRNLQRSKRSRSRRTNPHDK